MRLLQRLTRWIDKDLSRGFRMVKGADGKQEFEYNGRPGLAYLLLMIPLFGVAVVQGFPASGLSEPGLTIGVALSGLGFGFILWRNFRILRAKSLKTGRYYERKGRYFLPSEYRETTDACLENRRKG